MWRPFDWGVLRYLFVVAVFIVYHWWAAMAGAAAYAIGPRERPPPAAKWSALAAATAGSSLGVTAPLG